MSYLYQKTNNLASFKLKFPFFTKYNYEDIHIFPKIKLLQVIYEYISHLLFLWTFLQLSILTMFHSILVEQNSCPSKEYENIIDFLTSLVRRMLRKMKSQPLLFVEVLFWKTRKECHYINAEYLVHEFGSLKKETRNWENISMSGEIGSSQAKEWTRRSIADALGEDEADVVNSHELGSEK